MNLLLGGRVPIPTMAAADCVAIAPAGNIDIASTDHVLVSSAGHVLVSPADHIPVASPRPVGVLASLRRRYRQRDDDQS